MAREQRETLVEIPRVGDDQWREQRRIALGIDDSLLPTMAPRTRVSKFLYDLYRRGGAGTA